MCPQLRRSALYPRELARALEGHSTLALRSETHRDHGALFVDLHQVQLLQTPDWQVIYGRRGTGKTFMLRMMEHRVNEAVDTDRCLALLITAQDCLASPVGTEVDDQRRALAYFQRFIEILGDRLAAKADVLLGKPSFLDTLSGSRKRASDQIVSAVARMLYLTETGQAVAAFDNINRELLDVAKSSDETDGGFGVDASIRPTGLKASLTAHFDRGSHHSEAHDARTTTNRAAVPHFAGIRDVILELLDVLCVERLYILVDEWSVLDPSGAKDIQPTVAEMLKRSFAGTAKVSIKIAANRYQTRLSNRGAGTTYKGFEVGADIFEGVNLDRALLQGQDLYAFYEALLFKRLVYAEPKLGLFDPEGEGKPDEQFVVSIFKDRRAFAEVIKASEGVPRTFAALIKALAQMHNFQVTPLWTASAAQKCILEMSERAADDTNYQSEAARLLAERVKPVVTATRSRVFLVPKAGLAGIANALDELFEKRLIHDYGKSAMGGPVRERWYAYQIDYGVWLDWERALPPEEAGWPLVGLGRALSRTPPHLLDPVGAERVACLETLEEAGVYVIDTTNWGHDHVVRCNNCNATFAKDERCYELRGLCPHCFMPAVSVATD